MEIGRVFVDATMPLMLGVPQGGGKAFLYGPEHLRRQFRLILRAEADNKVIGLALLGAGVHGLNVHGFGNAVLVIIVPKTSGAPVHKAFFAPLSGMIPGIGNVVGKAGVVVIFGADAHFFADHFMTAMACWSSRCRASSSCKRR